MDLGLMASHGYPPGSGVAYNHEHGCTRVPKELHRFLHYRCPNQDLVNSNLLDLCLKQKEVLKFPGEQERNDVAMKKSGRPTFNDAKSSRLSDFYLFRACAARACTPADIHPQSLLLGFGIADQCSRQEKILKLLASGSIDVEDGLLDLSMLYDLIGPRELIMDLTQQPIAPYSKWGLCDDESDTSLIYPARELYMLEPTLNVSGDKSICRENIFLSTRDDPSHVPPPISDLYLSENTLKSSKRAMLVPYFERRRRGCSTTESSRLATKKVVPLKSKVKANAKTSQKGKMSSKTAKERDISSSSYLHACESLLSLIVDRKKRGRNAIISLKKSVPQLTELLTRFSASSAGAGVAVVLSVVCRVVCNGVPFCEKKLLSIGFGLGLVWISLAVNNLRNTVVSIRRSSGKLDGEDEEMMDRLDGDLKDVWFRAAAVLTVAVLHLA